MKSKEVHVRSGEGEDIMSEGHDKLVDTELVYPSDVVNGLDMYKYAMQLSDIWDAKSFMLMKFQENEDDFSFGDENKNVISSIKSSASSKHLNIDGSDKRITDEVMVRSLEAIFKMMIIDRFSIFGCLIFGRDFFTQHHRTLFSDPYKILAVLCLFGNIIGYLALTKLIKGSYLLFLFLTLPTIHVIFYGLNIPIICILVTQFFTIIKFFYVLIFVVTSIILSRGNDYFWCFTFGYIMFGIQFCIFGLCCDAFHVNNRVFLMKSFSVITLVFLFIWIALLHTNSLVFADYKVEFLGHFNFSMITLLGNSLTSLFVLSLKNARVAFLDPDRLGTISSLIETKKETEVESRMKRGLSNVLFKEEKQQEMEKFPSSVTSLEGKTKYALERKKLWTMEFEKQKSMLDEESIKKVEADSNLGGSGRKTKLIGRQLATVISVSIMDRGESNVDVFIIQSNFQTMLIESKHTLGIFMFGQRFFSISSKFVRILLVFWLIGAIVTLLALNKALENHFSLAMLLCWPTLFIQFGFLNMEVSKVIMFQFETIYLSIYAFVFCLCGALLIIHREFNWCYYLFYLQMWFCYLNSFLADASPAKTRRINNILGSLCTLFLSVTILTSLYNNWMDARDFLIPFYGSMNVSVSNQCFTAGFPIIIFSCRILFHAIRNPKWLVLLQGNLYIKKVKLSQVMLAQQVDKVLKI